MVTRPTTLVATIFVFWKPLFTVIEVVTVANPRLSNRTSADVWDTVTPLGRVVVTEFDQSVPLLLVSRTYCVLFNILMRA
jgi:hypothetical protein